VKMSQRRSNPNNNTNLHTNYIVQEIAASAKAKLQNDEDNYFCRFGHRWWWWNAGCISLFMIAEFKCAMSRKFAGWWCKIITLDGIGALENANLNERRDCNLNSLIRLFVGWWCKITALDGIGALENANLDEMRCNTGSLLNDDAK
jgi:hypothetical protein